MIDWEYAGMQDVHVDIAMFAIYAMYDREHVEKLIDAYFDNACERAIRIKIYAYIAVCGFYGATGVNIRVSVVWNLENIL